MSLAQNVIIIVILIVIIIIIIILMKSFEEQKLAAALFHIKFTHAMVYRSTLVYPTPDHLRRLFSNISTKRPHKRRSKCIKRGRSLEIKTLGSSPPLFFASTPAVSPSIKDHVFRIKSTSTLYWSSNRIYFVLKESDLISTAKRCS